MEIVYKIVQLLVCLFEVYLMFDFFSSFFSFRKILQHKCAKIGIVLALSLCVYIVNCFGSSVVNLLSMLVIYLCLLLLAFEGSYIKKISYYLTAIAIMVGSEFLFVILKELPSNFSLSYIEPYSFTMLISLICVKVIAFFLFNIVKRIPKKSSKKMDFHNLLIYSTIPVFTLGIMISIAYLNIEYESLGKIKFMLIFSCVLGMIGNALIFYAFDRHCLSLEQLQQQDLMITKLAMEEKHYEQIDELNREHAELLHDIHHYLKIIGEVALENKNDDVLAILEKLQIRVSDESKVVYCENNLLNVILNEKRKRAEEEGIDITFKIENGFYVDQIIDSDLIMIIGNLMDNALEAASQCERGYIKAYMFMQNENNYSVIKIQNNYVGEIVVHNDEIITSKNDKKRHGIGLKSISKAAEKYGGTFQMFYENGNFTAIVLLPVKKE